MIGWLIAGSITTEDSLQVKKATLAQAAVSIGAALLSFGAIFMLYSLTNSAEWGRKQAYKEVKELYEPLYGSLLKVIPAVEQFQNTSFLWHDEQNKVGGRLLEIRDPELYKKLNEFDSRLLVWLSNCDKIKQDFISALAFNTVFHKVYPNQSLTPESEKVAKNFTNSLSINQDIMLGFIQGKTLSEIFDGSGRGYYSDVDTFLNQAKSNFTRGTDQTFFKIDRGIYDDILQEVNKDKRVQDARKEQVLLLEKSAELKDLLERKILKPQLS